MKLLNKLKNDRQDLISNLLDNIESLEKLAFEQQAEIERLKEERDAMHRDVVNAEEYAWNLNKKLKTAKSEAIKEFAESLKEKAPNITEERFHILRNEIDNLVKEMVGDDNA